MMGGKSDSGDIHSHYSAVFISSLLYECPECVTQLI